MKGGGPPCMCGGHAARGGSIPGIPPPPPPPPATAAAAAAICCCIWAIMACSIAGGSGGKKPGGPATAAAAAAAAAETGGSDAGAAEPEASRLSADKSGLLGDGLLALLYPGRDCCCGSPPRASIVAATSINAYLSSPLAHPRHPHVAHSTERPASSFARGMRQIHAVP